MINLTILIIAFCCGITCEHYNKFSDNYQSFLVNDNADKTTSKFQYLALLLEKENNVESEKYKDAEKQDSSFSEETISESFIEKLESVVLIKIRSTINKKKSNNGFNYICIDHVYDQKTKTELKLLNPLLFKLRQKEITLDCNLNIIKDSDTILMQEESENQILKFTGDGKNESNIENTNQVYRKDKILKANNTNANFCTLNNIYKRNVPIIHQTRNGDNNIKKIRYNVFKIEDPSISNVIKIQLFKKKRSENGITNWLELTKGTPSRLGTMLNNFISTNYHVLFTYTDNSKELLAKQKLVGQYFLRPVRDKPYENYFLPEDDIIGNEDRNILSVKMQHFTPNKKIQKYKTYKVRNPNKNRFNSAGNFKSFRKINSEDSEDKIHLVYNGGHKSKITVAIDNFVDNVVKTSPHGIITEIYIDAVDAYKTVFVINMINDGLVQNKFKLSFTNLPKKISDLWHIKTPETFLVDAHNMQTTTIQMAGQLPIQEFDISVQLLSINDDVISERRALIKKQEKCYCIWECKCTCETSEIGLTCEILDLKSYRKAGFQGGLPPRMNLINKLKKRETNENIEDGPLFILIIIFIVLTGLLVMGFILALIRALLFGITYFCSSKNSKPTWKTFKIQLIDGALIPLVVSEKIKENENSFCLNVFYFYLVPISLLYFIYHVITNRKEFSGRDSNMFERRKNWKGDYKSFWSFEEAECNQESVNNANNPQNKNPVFMTPEKTIKAKKLWIQNERKRLHLLKPEKEKKGE